MYNIYEYMSELTLLMTTKNSAFGLSRLLAGVANPARALDTSEIERETIRLFDEHRTRLLRYVLSIGLSVHDGEEIVQEVFLSLFRHLQLGRPRDNLRGWLFRVAHHLALKQRQATHTRPDLVELDETIADQRADPAPSPEQQFAFTQRQQHLLFALQALPQRDQYCLHLRAEGLCYREIAQVLDMSLGAVSMSLARSIARLERVVGG
jgi:RNA polymerase sigma-70 factor, ECF subfamily